MYIVTTITNIFLFFFFRKLIDTILIAQGNRTYWSFWNGCVHSLLKKRETFLGNRTFHWCLYCHFSLTRSEKKTGCDSPRIGLDALWRTAARECQRFTHWRYIGTVPDSAFILLQNGFWFNINVKRSREPHQKLGAISSIDLRTEISLSMRSPKFEKTWQKKQQNWYLTKNRYIAVWKRT